MMRISILALLLAAFVSGLAPAQENAELKKLLGQEFNLGGKLSTVEQYYKMESCLKNYSQNGTLAGRDFFRLQLKYTPADLSGKEYDQITCLRFTVQFAGKEEIEIPELKNWKYDYIPMGRSEGGNYLVFGIDHAKFEKLIDAKGEALPADKVYHVYNAFIDFHSFCNVFGQSAVPGPAVQDLHLPGQKIVHQAAYSQAPVNLGANVDTGSYFQNGKITLEFKGVSLINGKPCALLEYDSGESSFKMNVTPMQGMKIKTTGTSHYKGDIYKDLQDNWVKRATLIEFVTTETLLPFPPDKIYSAAEREILVENVDTIK